MNARRARNATVAVATAAVVVGAAGVASAYFLTVVAPTGTGSASPSSGAVTLAAPSSSVAGLYPGGPAGTVSATVTNSFGKPITVTALLAGTLGITGAPGCTQPDLTVSSAALPLTVPNGATVSMTVLVSMGMSAQNECQGATISVPLTVRTGQ